LESYDSVRRPEYKDIKSKNRVLKNTNVKSTSTTIQKFSSSVGVVFNKHETMNLTVCQSNTNVLNEKNVNAVNDGSNYFRVKRALFTSLIAAKSRNLGATSVVAKSMFSVAKIPTSINKVSRIVHFDNDHFATITGYGDYVQGNLTICHVYNVEGLGNNLYSVRKFCDRDLEVAFSSNTCYILNLEGDDLLTGSHDSNLYTISSGLNVQSYINKIILWHRRLSHLNFGTINHHMKKDLVDGLPKFKYDKDHLFLAYDQG
ncbi:retrovirus-related pol polyprotein from transposon TNT 1-94, partial [Tanacetum coccineum]